MEMESVKRVVYWVTFFVLMLLLGVFMTAERLTVLFRVILVILLAFLSSMFRLERRYSFLSIVIVIVAGIFGGAVLANDSIQFWSFSFLYVLVFFLGCEVFERKLLGV
ncbi:hypothetical protein JW898_02435 [Candidatus Woesearchaeota archaeon]|nr:hypothetical protein [Candidatus Woesearchaeota archaeon]